MKAISNRLRQPSSWAAIAAIISIMAGRMDPSTISELIHYVGILCGVGGIALNERTAATE